MDRRTEKVKYRGGCAPTKNMSDVDRKRRKEYRKSYYYKRKNLLNYLINHVKKLENGCTSM